MLKLSQNDVMKSNGDVIVPTSSVNMVTKPSDVEVDGVNGNVFVDFVKDVSLVFRCFLNFRWFL